MPLTDCRRAKSNCTIFSRIVSRKSVIRGFRGNAIKLLQPDVKSAVYHQIVAFAALSPPVYRQHTQQEKIMLHKRWLVVLLALAGIAAATGIVAAQPGKSPGCGEYKYREDGECVDARDRKGNKTWVEEIMAKHWKP